MCYTAAEALCLILRRFHWLRFSKFCRRPVCRFLLSKGSRLYSECTAVYCTRFKSFFMCFLGATVQLHSGCTGAAEWLQAAESSLVRWAGTVSQPVLAARAAVVSDQWSVVGELQPGAPSLRLPPWVGGYPAKNVFHAVSAENLFVFRSLASEFFAVSILISVYLATRV